MGLTLGDALGSLIEPGQLVFDAGQTIAPGRELASHCTGFGDGVVGRLDVGEHATLVDNGPFRGFNLEFLLRQLAGLWVQPVEFGTHGTGIGDQGLDHTFVGRGDQLAFQTAAAFGDQCSQPAGPFTDRFDPAERIGDVALAHIGERSFGVENRDVEFAQARLDGRLFAGEFVRLFLQPTRLGLEARKFAADQMHPNRAQFVDHAVVAACRVGLLLERAEAAPDLAQQVVEANEVAFGGFEAPLGLLAPLAVLQDPGGFFDDAATIFGPRVQDRIELTLPDDDVLLATDATVGEHLLNIEQAARRAVDRVLGVAAAEERPSDRDLGELDRQQIRTVVDGERHLGATERGTIRRAREDDVVHLPAAQGARALGAQHPSNGIDQVGFAGPIGTDHDHDAGFELEHGLIRKRLEPA